MSLRWLKPYLPSGLYGRTTLGLLLPVVTLLLVVSVVFVQRHFEGVTQQMVATVAREVALVQEDAASRYARFVQEAPALAKRLPLFHIASHLGVTPTQLSRVRKKAGSQPM